MMDEHVHKMSAMWDEFPMRLFACCCVGDCDYEIEIDEIDARLNEHANLLRVARALKTIDDRFKNSTIAGNELHAHPVFIKGLQTHLEALKEVKDILCESRDIACA